MTGTERLTYWAKRYEMYHCIAKTCRTEQGKRAAIGRMAHAKGKMLKAIAQLERV